VHLAVILKERLANGKRRLIVILIANSKRRLVVILKERLANSEQRLDVILNEANND